MNLLGRGERHALVVGSLAQRQIWKRRPTKKGSWPAPRSRGTRAREAKPCHPPASLVFHRPARPAQVHLGATGCGSGAQVHLKKMTNS